MRESTLIGKIIFSAVNNLLYLQNNKKYNGIKDIKSFSLHDNGNKFLDNLTQII